MQTIIRILTAAGLLIASAGVHADVISFEISGDNDCAGYYGKPFESCAVFAEDDDQKTPISSIISKFDRDEDMWSHSSLFDSETADYTLSYSGDGATGSWSYSGPDGIRYWVAKAGNGFIVYYDTDDAGCTDANASTAACMNTANVVTGGDWTTPSSKGLSHISFYDSEIKVPEPATLGLLGLGLLGIGLSRRRRVR